MVITLNRSKVERLVDTIRSEAGSTIFRVQFIKRTTGEVRTMLCRFGVGRGIVGTGMAYDPLGEGLLTIYDVQRGGWRSIPLENIISLQIRGTVYEGPRKIHDD